MVRSLTKKIRTRCSRVSSGPFWLRLRSRLMIGLGVGFVPRPFLDPTINRRYQVVSSRVCMSRTGRLPEDVSDGVEKTDLTRSTYREKKTHTHKHTPLLSTPPCEVLGTNVRRPRRRRSQSRAFAGKLELEVACLLLP